ncbi:isopenicillin N synthase-like dioxygenase [Nakamurella sp. UYEF19]|uniref:isopenicillin N synthase family dioxygenase n=1 Tax=Nakamurella sp. UYEF19 TaxID=1756392 RepID=UPI003396FC30
MTIESLPVLDLSELDGGGRAAEDFLTRLRQATHDVGFFYLVGHGVPQTLVDTMISTAHSFFALPVDDKMAIENLKSPHFRGYTRIGGERTQGRTDWREQIDIGPERPAVEPGPEVPEWERLEGPNQWPAAMPELRGVVTRWDAEMMGVGLRLLRAWARALGQPADVFDEAFADRPSTLLKIVRYPGRSGRNPMNDNGSAAPADEADRQGVGSHKDGGVLTLLLLEPGTAGLQVQHDGGWIDAPPMPGAFVVNIGELLEVATNGYLKATVHRVLSPPDGSERISIPFFYNPALSSTIPMLTLPSELQAEAVGITADPDNPLYATYGANLLKSRLRAHPDVAAIHHADLLAARR